MIEYVPEQYSNVRRGKLENDGSTAKVRGVRAGRGGGRGMILGYVPEQYTNVRQGKMENDGSTTKLRVRPGRGPGRGMKIEQDGANYHQTEKDEERWERSLFCSGLETTGDDDDDSG